MTVAHIVGMLGALVLLAGRWSLARVSGDSDADNLLIQPRCWLVAALGLLVVLQATRPLALRRLRIGWSEFWLLAMLGYMVASVTWAPSTDTVMIKTGEVALEAVAVLLLAVGLSLFDRQKLDFGFWATLLVVGLVLAALSLSASVTGRAVSPGGGPITFGRNMGLMAMAAWRLAERNSMVHRFASAGVIALAILLIVMCGSRGALLAATVGGMVLVVVANLPAVQKALAVSAIALLATGVLTFTEVGRNASQVFEQRIVKTTLHNRHMAGREDLWAEAAELFREAPVFGLGIDGFRANSWHYPHNIFLEVGVEGGLIAIGLLLMALASWAFRWRRRRHYVYAGSVAAVVVALVSAQTSGDLYDSRCVFLLMVMASPVPNTAPRDSAAHAALSREHLIARPRLVGSTG